MKDRSRPGRGRALLAGTVALLALPWAAPATGQTAASAVRPEAVALEPGGAAVEVAVRGRGLAGVESVEVTDRGRAVDGVAVRILRRADMELLVSVQAGRGARQGQGYRLTLVTAKERVDGLAAVSVVSAGPDLAAVEAPPTLTAGGRGTLVVRLDGPAPRQGTAVALASDDPAVLDVARSLTVPAGATKAEIEVGPAADVAAARTVRIRAALGDVRAAADVTVVPGEPVLESLEVDVAVLEAGESTQATVVLDRPAPEGGTVVSLAVDGGPGLTAPAEVVVAVGASSASAVLEAGSVPDDRSLTLRGTYGPDEHSVGVTVRADPALSEPDVEPASPTVRDVGVFLVTLMDPTASAEPAEPVTLDVGSFLVTLMDPSADMEPQEPVTVSVGAFVVTLAPPTGGDS
ncbi:MAG: hypothetical protein RJQ04_04025 [Longimicrobiales bacterium]